MQPSGQKPDSAERELEVDLGARPLPFQWSLLAWAALVGTLTGGAVVAFHELLAFINNGLFGTFVEGLLALGQGQPPELPPELPPIVQATGTPLQALLQVGLGGLQQRPTSGRGCSPAASWRAMRHPQL